MGSCPNSLRAHRWARYKIEGALARHGFVAAFGAEMAFSTTDSFHSLVVVMPFINAALRAPAFIDVAGAATVVIEGRLPIPFVGCRVPSLHQLVYPSLPTVAA